MANLHEDELQPMGSWTEAVKKSKGYQDKTLVSDLIQEFKINLPNRIHKNQIIDLSQRQVHLLLVFLKTLLVKNKQTISIGDFGGGNGYMCDFLRDINLNCKIIYDVYETREIATGYNKIGKELNIDFLDTKKFGEKKYDLIILSCVLQYTNNWRKILTMAGKISNNILIMRLPLIDSNKNKYFVQHNKDKVYGLSQASWPLMLFSKKLFTKEIQKTFKIIFKLTDSEENFPCNGKNYPMNTLLLETKKL